MRTFSFLLFAALLLGGCELVGTDAEAVLDPALRTPDPTGAYATGTTVRFVSDVTRDDGYTAEVGDPRELKYQVWYPTDETAGDRALYLEATIAQFLASTQDYMPREDLVALADELETTSFEDAPASASGPFPIVFLSHGFTGLRQLHGAQAEEIASHGYVVVTIDHTYGGLAVELPGGEVRTLATNPPPFRDVVSIWAQDLSSVLDHLEAISTSDPVFGGALDLTRVGATGHSTGGSAAIEVHTFDDRFSAAASMDAPQVGTAAEGGALDDPALLFFAQPSEYAATLVQDALTGPGYQVTIAETTHYTFFDLPVLLQVADADPARAQASSRPPGTIDASLSQEIILAYTVAFFDRHLKGLPAGLLARQTPYDAVTYQILTAP